MQNTQLSKSVILEYLRSPYEEQNRAAKLVGTNGDKIDKAITAVRSRDGMLTKLQIRFINQAPDQWKQGMFEGGYGQDKTFKVITSGASDQGRAGLLLEDIDYKELFFDAIKPGASRSVPSQPKGSNNLIQWTDIDVPLPSDVREWSPTGIYSR